MSFISDATLSCKRVNKYVFYFTQMLTHATLFFKVKTLLMSFSIDFLKLLIVHCHHSWCCHLCTLTVCYQSASLIMCPLCLNTSLICGYLSLLLASLQSTVGLGHPSSVNHLHCSLPTCWLSFVQRLMLPSEGSEDDLAKQDFPNLKVKFLKCIYLKI